MTSFAQVQKPLSLLIRPSYYNTLNNRHQGRELEKLSERQSIYSTLLTAVVLYSVIIICDHLFTSHSIIPKFTLPSCATFRGYPW